ncbi:MAG: META domain-containing protein [Treponema sp.]|nr:META domain-containing protein [Treponema sp.]
MKPMKKTARSLFPALSLLTFLAFSACATAETPAEGASFRSVEGRGWVLTELRRGGRTIPIAPDRQKLNAAGFEEIYTINFSIREGMVRGLGAPNRFFGPFTLGKGEDLTMGNLASTMMISFIEPESLREHEYLAYLSGVLRWALVEGRLELYSSSAGGTAVLVFE